MNQKQKLKLKKAKEELDKFLDEKGLGKLKDIERELIGIKRKIEGNKPIDVREKLSDIKKEITKVKAYPEEKLVKIEEAIRELIRKPSKDYSKNIEGIISVIERIETNSLREKLTDIEKKVEKLVEKPTKDYTEKIQEIAEKIQETIEAIKEIRTYDQKENTEKIIKTIKEEFIKVRPKDYRIVLGQILEESKKEKDVNVKNFPLSEIEEYVQGVLDIVLKATISAFIINREPKDAIPVVLTRKSRREFYDAIFNAMVGGIDTTTLESELETIKNNTRIPSAVGDGRKVVAATGVAERLVATSTLCKYVDIMAELDNTNYVVVGGSTVIAALATRRGIPLYAGQSIRIEVDDLHNIWIDSIVNGEGVTFTYYN